MKIQMGSLEEYTAVSEDLDHQVGKSSSSIHNSGATSSFGGLLVGSARLNTSSEIRVNGFDRGFVGLLGPFVEVTIIYFSSINGEFSNHSTYFRSIGFPSTGSEREFGEPLVSIADRVPDGMEVGDTGFGGVRNVLEVATSISLGVGVTDLGSGVKRLMDITGVMDDKAEGKGLLVSDGREVALNLLIVSGVFVIVSVHQEVGQILEGINVGNSIGLELREVCDGLGGVGKVRLINEMPVLLPIISHRLNNISEGGTLNEGLIYFSVG